MDRSGLQIDSAHPTSTVTITFNEGEPEFDIVADRAIDYIDRYSIPPLLDKSPPLPWHACHAQICIERDLVGDEE